jgi:hypothetical protein
MLDAVVCFLLLMALLSTFTQSLDGDQIAISVSEKRQDLQSSGKKLWCAKARTTVVHPLERQR